MVEEYDVTTPRDRNAFLAAVGPLLFDVALPVGLYYVLTGEGASSTLALILSGLIPGLRSVDQLVRQRSADRLTLMMVGLFALSLVLLAITGSPRFLLVKESFGTVAVGVWCLFGARGTRPLTFYTARPMITHGKVAADRVWERLADTSEEFHRIQTRLSYLWGVALLVEAALRVAIALHYPVHTAAGLVNVPIVAIIVGCSILSGPLGGARLQKLVEAGVADERNRTSAG